MNISQTFPKIFDQAISLNEALTPIFLVFTITALIGKGVQCMYGDMRGMISGITLTVIVSILIPTFPEIINTTQLALHEIAQSAGANPTTTANDFAKLIVGESGDKDVGFLDIVFDKNGGLSKALIYALISFVSGGALVIQYAYSIGQQFLMIFAIALSPIFFGFLLLKDTRGIAVNYFLNTFSITMWPIGFAVSYLGTSALLELGANNDVTPGALPGFAHTSTNLFVAAVICLWMVVSTIYTPKLITKVITTGANAGGALLQRMSSATTLGTTYGIMARGTSVLAGASTARTNTATAVSAAGGVLAGATETSPMLLPAIIGVTAAGSSFGSKNEDGTPTDYNAKAAEITKRNKS